MVKCVEALQQVSASARCVGRLYFTRIFSLKGRNVTDGLISGLPAVLIINMWMNLFSYKAQTKQFMGSVLEFRYIRAKYISVLA